MFRLRLPAALPAAIAVALAACSDSTQPTDPAASPDNPDLRASGSQQPAGPLALGKTVRGFGGFFLDAQGAPTVIREMDPIALVLQQVLERGPDVGIVFYHQDALAAVRGRAMAMLGFHG